jgi:hypothetical protein
MIDIDIRRAIVFKRALIAAYVGVAVVSGIGLARGWSDSSSGVSRQVISCLILALCGATLFVQNMSGNQRPFASFDILKFIACIFGALVWLFIATRIVPDTSVGRTIVMIPTMGLFLWGLYYLSGPFGSMWRGATAIWLKSETVPLSASYQASPVSDLQDTGPDRLEVGDNYGAIAGRYFAGIFLGEFFVALRARQHRRGNHIGRGRCFHHVLRSPNGPRPGSWPSDERQGPIDPPWNRDGHGSAVDGYHND